MINCYQFKLPKISNNSRGDFCGGEPHRFERTLLITVIDENIYQITDDLILIIYTPLNRHINQSTSMPIFYLDHGHMFEMKKIFEEMIAKTNFKITFEFIKNVNTDYISDYPYPMFGLIKHSTGNYGFHWYLIMSPYLIYRGITLQTEYQTQDEYISMEVAKTIIPINSINHLYSLVIISNDPDTNYVYPVQNYGKSLLKKLIFLYERDFLDNNTDPKGMICEHIQYNNDNNNYDPNNGGKMVWIHKKATFTGKCIETEEFISNILRIRYGFIYKRMIIFISNKDDTVYTIDKNILNKPDTPFIVMRFKIRNMFYCRGEIGVDSIGVGVGVGDGGGVVHGHDHGHDHGGHDLDFYPNNIPSKTTDETIFGLSPLLAFILSLKNLILILLFAIIYLIYLGRNGKLPWQKGQEFTYPTGTSTSSTSSTGTTVSSASSGRSSTESKKPSKVSKVSKASRESRESRASRASTTSGSKTKVSNVDKSLVSKTKRSLKGFVTKTLKKTLQKKMSPKRSPKAMV